MKFKQIAILGAILFTSCSQPELTQWPEAKIEARPGARWWWLGNAVDSANIKSLIKQYAEAGLGTMEITPIYGVQGCDTLEIEFLSKRWMQMYNLCVNEAQKNKMVIDMNTGTGWPFGGPTVSIDDAACKMLVEKYNIAKGDIFNDTIISTDKRQRDTATLLKLMAYSSDNEVVDITDEVDKNKHIKWAAGDKDWTIYAIFCGHTMQMVKRAAPGGEGLVMNHFSKKAVDNYLKRFSDAFRTYSNKIPHNFFNDSYEIYGADCTPDIFNEFESRRGYKLENYLPYLLSKERNDTISRIKSDYCETLSDLLYENFTTRWTDWAHKMGSSTRNQAHGSPANLIDIYAGVDIPECEGFGLSDFGIKGLRRDSLTRRNDSDLSMLKYASSAAHISGRQLTSSETFTWLTEHFRTSFSQCKPDLDLMFVSGVNHVYFHGTTYSPTEAEWPGWKFYASVDMSPTNPLWRDAKPFFKYIERAQSFLQMGRPDNDFLVYVPTFDMWHEQSQMLLQFTIHDMAKRAPQFIEAINNINAAGFDVDYISDKFIKSSSVDDNGNIVTIGNAKYKAIIIPSVEHMPTEILQHLLYLTKRGATIIFAENYPSTVPGFTDLQKRNEKLKELIEQLPQTDFSHVNKTTLNKGTIITGSDYNQILPTSGIRAEQMRTKYGLHCIRRANNTGYHYFITNLTPNDVDDIVEIAVDATSAMFFDPMTGRKGEIDVRNDGNNSKIRLQLASGESIILRTFTKKQITADPWKYKQKTSSEQTINKGWKISFVESTPEITDTFNVDTLCAWTSIDNMLCKQNMGTARYTTTFYVDAEFDDAVLDLGDVRETARVSINNKEASTLWAVPYRTEIGQFLQKGQNTIEIDVTGLPANRISQLDKDSIVWRKFKEINIVDINYRKTSYSWWPTTDCGLLGPIKILYIKK